MDINKVFNILGEDSREQDEIREEIGNFTNSPYYRMGMYKKLLSSKNHYMKGIYISLNMGGIINAGGNIELEDEEKMMKFAEYLLYTRAFKYIEDCDFNKLWVKEIKFISDLSFLELVQKAILIHEKHEEYEKCAHLVKISNIVREKLGEGKK